VLINKNPAQKLAPKENFNFILGPNFCLILIKFYFTANEGKFSWPKAK